MAMRRSPKFEFEGRDDAPDQPERPAAGGGGGNFGITDPPARDNANVDDWGNPIVDVSGDIDRAAFNGGIAGRHGETPRERGALMEEAGFGSGGLGGAQGAGAGAPGAQVAARRPATPEPAMGSAVDAPSGGSAAPQGLLPFSPMSTGPDPAEMATPRLRSLYGGVGGLKQGGLGVPGSASPAAETNVSELIRQLLSGLGG